MIARRKHTGKMLAGACVVAAAFMFDGSRAAAQGTSGALPGLRAERLYFGVGRTVPIVVSSVPGATRSALVLLSEAGNPVFGPVSVRPGRVDLTAVVTNLWEMRQAHYLQLLVDDVPTGSALVIQPLLSRQVPVTRIEPHPVTGNMHQRIIGWRDENAPEGAVVATPALPPPLPTNNPATDDDEDEGIVITPMTPMGGPEHRQFSFEPLLSGLRIFPERDVIMKTSLGEIRFVMSHAAAPNTAWNFLHLCENGFYDGVGFHRIVPLTRNGDPFVIQGGDPTGTGDGGPGWWLPLEPSDLPHDFGVISMARADDPDSAGSQFFVCLSRAGTARLDGQYCAFGYAIDGAPTIVKIASVQLADVAAGRPVDPPLMTRTEVVAAPPRKGGVDRRIQRVQPPLVERPRESGRVPR